jgi:hypothetical protein
MKKLHIFTIILLAIFQLQCKKITSCNADICSSKRITKQTASNQEGVMGIYINNNERRWMINVFNNPGSGLKMTCIICGDIPDSLKVMTKSVVFSGELKDASGIVDSNEEIKFFIITPSSIR